MEKPPSHNVFIAILLLANAAMGGCSHFVEEQAIQMASWPSYEHLNFSGRSEETTSGQNSGYYSYISARSWLPGSGTYYFGAEATIDVYGFHLQPNQLSSAAIWILNRGDGQESSFNGIQIGWMVYPSFYKDSKTHFYISWMSGGFHKSCINMRCPGFKKTSSSISPGDVINKVSNIHGKRQYITLRLLKDKSSGDWHVHYGFNGNPKPVGYFPKSLIPGMIGQPVEIMFGGNVVHEKPLPSPPMGSGYVPASGNAASFGNLKLIDIDGIANRINNNMAYYVNPKNNCYPVTNIASDQFFYGGSSCDG